MITIYISLAYVIIILPPLPVPLVTQCVLLHSRGAAFITLKLLTSALTETDNIDSNCIQKCMNPLLVVGAYSQSHIPSRQSTEERKQEDNEKS